MLELIVGRPLVVRLTAGSRQLPEIEDRVVGHKGVEVDLTFSRHTGNKTTH
jgi:hypothetical protein